MILRALAAGAVVASLGAAWGVLYEGMRDRAPVRSPEGTPVQPLPPTVTVRSMGGGAPAGTFRYQRWMLGTQQYVNAQLLRGPGRVVNGWYIWDNATHGEYTLRFRMTGPAGDSETQEWTMLLGEKYLVDPGPPPVFAVRPGPGPGW